MSEQSNILVQTVPNLKAFEEDLEASICKQSFYEFIKRSWSVVDGSQFLDNWHIGALAEYLSATVPVKSSGTPQIRKLAINIPPRMAKSRIVSVLFPAWVFGACSPEKKFLYASYSEGLAVDDSDLCRDLIKSDWYMNRFKDVRISKTQDQKLFFKTSRGGFRRATSVGGKGAGMGGNYIVGDDILNSNDRNSEVKIKEANNWWGSVISSRRNNPRNDVFILVGQRLNQNDIFGSIIDKGENWEWLVLPNEYQGKKFVSSIGFEDPRTEIGELLFPERVDKETTDDLKISQGELSYSTQYNQQPINFTGNIFQKKWFENRINIYEINSTWLSFDTAATDLDKSAFSACTVGEITADYHLVVKEVIKGKYQFPELLKFITEMIEKHQYKLAGVIIEDKSSGTQAIQTLRQTAPAHIKDILIPFQPKGDKVERAWQAALWCETGMVKLPIPSALNNEWLPEFEKDLFEFPQGKFKDTVDSFDQLIIYLENALEEGLRYKMQKQRGR